MSRELFKKGDLVLLKEQPASLSARWAKPRFSVALVTRDELPGSPVRVLALVARSPIEVGPALLPAGWSVKEMYFGSGWEVVR